MSATIKKFRIKSYKKNTSILKLRKNFIEIWSKNDSGQFKFKFK